MFVSFHLQLLVAPKLTSHFPLPKDSARLLAANLSQYIVVVYMLLVFLIFRVDVRDQFNKESTKAAVRNYTEYVIQQSVSDEQALAISAQIGSLMGDYLGDLIDTNMATVNCTDVPLSRSDVFTNTCPEFLSCDRNQTSTSFCALVSLDSLEGYDQLTLLQGSGLKTDVLIQYVTDGMKGAIEKSIDSLYPQKESMVMFPITIAMVVAVLTSLYLAVTYFPNITATTLQLRSGVITLSNEKLKAYRAAVSCVRKSCH